VVDATGPIDEVRRALVDDIGRSFGRSRA